MRFKGIFSQDGAQIERKKPLPWIVDPTLSAQDGLLPNLADSRFEHSRKSDADVDSDEDTGKEKRPSAFPGFKRHLAPNPIELFYELFIVANLSAFMEAQSISDSSTLKSYIGYISLLWFTWLQTTLFDVRYNTDSIVSRVFRLLQIGFMLAFSIIGPNFNTHDTQEHPTLLRDVSLVLMATRFVLVLQYSTVAWYTRKYRGTFLAMLVPIVTLLCASIVYLAIAVTSPNRSGARSYIGWYTVAGVEAAVMLVAPILPTLSDLNFDNTTFVERFNGLTLIVLGEAVVGMTKAAASIAQGTESVTKSSVGLLISYIMTVYCMYVIYFDQLENTRIDAIWRQLWAILHFPLHIAMLLNIDGSRAAILYNTGRALIWKLANDPVFSFDWYVGDMPAVVDSCKGMVNLLLKSLGTDEKMPDFQPIYDQLLNLTLSEQTNLTVNGILDEFDYKMTLWVQASLNSFSTVSDIDRDTYEVLNEVELQTSYLYVSLFIGAGCTLISLAVLHWFGKSPKTRGEILSITITAVIGVGLALVSLVIVTDQRGKDGETLGTNYLWTPWPQPTILLTFAMVIVIDRVIVWASYRRHYKPIV